MSPQQSNQQGQGHSQQPASIQPSSSGQFQPLRGFINPYNFVRWLEDTNGNPIPPKRQAPLTHEKYYNVPQKLDHRIS